MKVEYAFDFQLKHNYVDYFWQKGFFLPPEIELLEQWRQAMAPQKARMSGDRKYEESIRKSSVMFLAFNERTNWLYQKLSAVVQRCNLERFHFDISGFAEQLQLTEYNEGDFFDWHMDFGAREISARKVSITVQLSDPDEYEGGELQFMSNNNIVVAPRERGTVVVFPSFVTHRVTPVTRGVRRSIVGWASGPPYR